MSLKKGFNLNINDEISLELHKICCNKLKNDNNLLYIYLSVLNVLKSISKFIQITKELNTIFDYEKNILKFSGRGFPTKNDLSTLVKIVSNEEYFEYFKSQLKDFEIIIRMYLEEEIWKVYKNFKDIEKIYEKYELIFYEFQKLKISIFNAIDKFEEKKESNQESFDSETILKLSKQHFNKVIDEIENPIDYNEILENWVNEVQNNKH